MIRVSDRGWVLVLALSLVGCGGGPVIPETIPVKGTVTYQDKPVEGAQVLLSSSDPKGKPASAVTAIPVSIRDQNVLRIALPFLKQRGAPVTPSHRFRCSG